MSQAAGMAAAMYKIIERSCNFSILFVQDIWIFAKPRVSPRVLNLKNFEDFWRIFAKPRVSRRCTKQNFRYDAMRIFELIFDFKNFGLNLQDSRM
jgi:hypothetical protein